MAFLEWSGWRQLPGTSVAKAQQRAAHPVPTGRLAARAGISLALTLGFVWLLSDRWAQLDIAALGEAFARLRPWQWALALILTAVSFWAVGRYDAVLHRHFATGMPARPSRRAGICAIAVSQTLGLGLISGAILRWRMLPGISLWQATQLTAAVALSFLAGWAVVTAATLIALPQAPFRGWAAAVLGLASALTIVSLIAPRLPGLRIRWPNGFTLARLAGLCAIDTIAAALSFHALLPETSALTFTALLPAFLLALGAGLALGTPGGMGAFEVTLMALLPVTPEAELLATVLAWRLVYHVLPAVIGAGLAIRGPEHVAPPLYAVLKLPPDRRAETGLCRQGSLEIIAVSGQLWLAGRRGHTLTAMLDPMGSQAPKFLDNALRGLFQLARNEGRMPAIYKAGARLAVRARLCGLAIRRTGWEAWIAPQGYRLSSSSRSGLRRKLRRAEAAGVTVRVCPAAAVPWEALDRIAADWAECHGGERGFSMGRYDRGLLESQRLYVAWADGHPIAFASFHIAPQEWALDLMRHGSALPDGTMHSLIQAAIEDAAKAGLARLSLAAVPDAAFGCPDLAARLIVAVAPQAAATGLYRFKACFAPQWSPLYLIAPNRFGLALVGLSLWRAIARPEPIMPQIERDHAEYGFASDPNPWHIAEDSR